MKHLNAILIAALILLTSGCSRGLKEDELRVSEPEVTASLDKGPGTICSCKSSCSGYTPPCTLDPDSKVCSMKLPARATGRMGGFGGGNSARAQ